MSFQTMNGKFLGKSELIIEFNGAIYYISKYLMTKMFQPINLLDVNKMWAGVRTMVCISNQIMYEDHIIQVWLFFM